MAFGDKLKYYRKYHNYSQKQLAEKLCISQSTYSKYESGTAEPSIDKLKTIASCLNVSIDYLLENYNDDVTQDIVDFEYFIMHGNYSLYSIVPTNKDRKMLRDIIRAIYKNNRAEDVK